MAQLEPKYGELAERMTGAPPNVQSEAMGLTNPLAILYGSGAKYLKAASPKLYNYMQRSPVKFGMFETSAPFKGEFESSAGLAYPFQESTGAFNTFINPLLGAAERGRTAIHEALHSLFYAKTGSRRWAPSVTHTQKIYPRFEERGLTAGPSGRTLEEFGQRYFDDVVKSGGEPALGVYNALGESTIEGMTDSILKGRAKQFTKGLPEDEAKWMYDAAMDLMTRGGGPLK